MKDFSYYSKNKNVIKEKLNYNKALIFCRLFNNDTFNFSYLKKKIPPMGWNWLYFSENIPLEKIGTDGHPKRGSFYPKFFGCKRMFAGSELFFLDKVLLDSIATKTSQISKIENKSIKNKKIFFVTVKNIFKIKNKKVLIENQKIVYVDKNFKSKKKSIENHAEYKLLSKANFQFNNIMLFRYSAITFNSHRIHYDVDYTKKEEGYKNLLVHGPLLASFSLEYLNHISKNIQINYFSFKIIKPVYVNEEITFKIFTTKDNKELKLTVINKSSQEVKLIGVFKTE